MDDVVITWSASNWITVCVMAAVGLAIVILAAQAVHAVKARASNSGE